MASIPQSIGFKENELASSPSTLHKASILLQMCNNGFIARLAVSVTLHHDSVV